MDITQMWLYLFDGLAIDGDHQVQYTVRGRMLRANVDHKIALFGIRYFFEHTYSLIMLIGSS